MMRYFPFLVVVLSAAMAAPLFAFSKAGHMASGGVAYETMALAERDAIAAILEHHPYVAEQWAAELSAVEPRKVPPGERLFMLAAAWPDEVRNGAGRTYNHPKAHYVNLAYTPGSNGPGTIMGGDLLTALPSNLLIAGDHNERPENRAVAISWVLHLVGDLHEPLHVATLFDDQFPKGDKGGSDFFVRMKAMSRPTNLRSAWDAAATKRLTDFAGAQDNAYILKKAHPASAFPQLGNRSPTAFTEIANQESYALAVKYAYLDGALKGSTEREAKAGGDEKVPLTPITYADHMDDVSASQLALAGYRAALILEQVAH